MTPEQTFVERMKERRVALGMSQHALAMKVTDSGVEGFYSNTLARIERGEQRLRLNWAVAIASALGCDLSSLLGVGSLDVTEGAHPLSVVMRIRDALDKAGYR